MPLREGGVPNVGSPRLGSQQRPCHSSYWHGTHGHYDLVRTTTTQMIGPRLLFSIQPPHILCAILKIHVLGVVVVWRFERPLFEQRQRQHGQTLTTKHEGRSSWLEVWPPLDITYIYIAVWNKEKNKQLWWQKMILPKKPILQGLSDKLTENMTQITRSSVR